ncbi:GNAT family N-acetyltransferase [Pedobacter yulinensis]|uniref:GNAT family N-acetyltransferase n=1 Tax=Pedobacter yulinensis TaxID=2126353 RepID=A0A2T3HI28_9SPHI|nr:GNAT family N-acetyltransferase [Pedobacter yulinensis]PST82098.1 GNAT family N-acetyltransferase [Pedobacter yulinensis]
MEIRENDYIFSDDQQLIDLLYVHQYLSKEAYWSADIPLSVVKKSINNSLCFGIYRDNKQVGFARWITDKATFAYLCDVFVDQAHRGAGLSKKLMSFMIFHPDLQGLRRYMLATRDAHGLYEQFGFRSLENADQFMAISVKDVYKKQ